MAKAKGLGLGIRLGATDKAKELGIRLGQRLGHGRHHYP